MLPQPPAEGLSNQEMLKDTHTESTSISPYEFLIDHLRVQEQRLNQSSVNQFILHQPRSNSGQRCKDSCFVIREEEEQNSRLYFTEANERFSTIPYKQSAAFHELDPESSDLMIKEWLQHEENQLNLKGCPYLPHPFHSLLPKENRAQETHQFQKIYLFNTQESYILEIDSAGRIKQLQKPKTTQKRGILLTGKGRK